MNKHVFIILRAMHALMCVSALLGIAIFIGCPTETPASNNSGGRGNTGSASVFKLVENATKETIVAAETVETSANALLNSTTSGTGMLRAANKLHSDAQSMYDKARDTKDAAQKVVDEVKADESSASASSGSSFITSSVTAGKKSARLVAAKAALDVAIKALQKADAVLKAAEAVKKDAENNNIRNVEKIREVIKVIASIKIVVKQVQVVSKTVETVKANTTTETISIVGDGFEEKSKGQYEATMEVGDTANFEIKDVGVGAGNLTYKKTKGANNKFNVAVNKTDRTIKFESNTPTADTYTYTISKAKTGSNTPAKAVTVTITVKAKQEFITLNTSFAQMEAGKTADIIFTDSGEGTGNLSETYKKGPGDGKFTVAKTGQTITFTPKASPNAPAVGVYVYTINKAKTGTNTKAAAVTLVIEVVKKIEAKTETIDLDTKAATITVGSSDSIVVADSGVGLGVLTATYKSSGSTSDGFLPVVSRRSITFTPKNDPNAPAAGKYIYTISKAKTGKNTKAKDVEVTITVKEQPKVLAFATATTEGKLSNFEALAKTSATMKQAAAPNTDKLVINDIGYGDGALSITAVSKAKGSVNSAAFKGIFTVTEAKDKITITPKDKLVNAEVGVYTLTIKKADVAATKTFTLTVKKSAQNTSSTPTVYAIGGRDDTNQFNDVWSSKDGVSWTKLADTSSFSERSGHQVAVLNNTMYLIGGTDGSNNYFSDVWSSTDGTNWRKLKDDESGGVNKFTQRYAHQVVAINNTMYLIGGYDGNPLDDVWASTDGRAWTKKTVGGSAFSKRNYHMAFQFNNKLYITGGYDKTNTAGGKDYSDIYHSNDIKTSLTLTTVNNANSGLDTHGVSAATVVRFNNSVFLLGGSNSYQSGYLNTIYKLDSTGTKWSKQTSSSFPKISRHQAFVLGGKIYLVGGEINDGNKRLNTKVYSSSDGVTWKEETKGNFPQRKNFQVVVM